MRVISGTWRGRRLHAPAGASVRPTSDRVKEALFNLLGADVAGAVFVDLCCGAGGLGIEALSRGAAHAVFVDRSPESLAATRDNLALCGVPAASCTLIRSEARSWLDRWRPPLDSSWLLVGDPPYRDGLTQAIMSRVEQLSAAAGFLAAVVEHDAAETAGLADGHPRWTLRRYGGTGLAVLRPAADEE